MTTGESPHQQRTSPKTIRKERVLPALKQDLSGYTPQRHFRKLQGRVYHPRVLKSSRVQSCRNEAIEETRATTPGAQTAKIVETADDASAPDLPPRAEIARVREGSENRTVLPVRNAAVKTTTTTPSVPKRPVKPAEETPAQPLQEIFRNGRRSVPRSALRVPQMRNVAGGAAQWRTSLAEESSTSAPPPPLPAPILPKPKPKTPTVKTYKTKVRSTLPEQSQHGNVDGHSEEQGRDGVNAESKHSKSGYDLEPVTSSFRFPEDSSPLVLSQESRSLEDYLRGRRRASQVPAHSRHAKSTDDGISQPAEIGEELDQDEDEGQDDEQHDEQHDEQDEERDDAQKQSFDEESLTEMEIELLDIGDGYDRSYPLSASSSPKRQRSVDTYESSEGGQQRDGNALEDADQRQQPVKKRRTERRVPSAEIRRSALRELNDRRASKATRQTTDTSPRVAKKSKKKKKPRKSKKQKSAKQPRRLPDHGELIIGPERLEESDMEIAPTPPFELSQDPISQISDGDEEEDARRPRGVPLAMTKIPKGFGKVDISLFRMPHRPRSQSTIAQITTYSDGFSGKEREPTGRLMPLKQPSRRKESCQIFTIRYGQLALVTEKPSEKTPQEPRRQKMKSQKLKKKVPETVIHQPEEDQMLMGEQEEPAQVGTVSQDMGSTEAVAQPQTPVLADKSLPSSTPAGNTSPMKRKSQRMRVGPRASQQLAPRAMTQRPVAVNHIEGMARPPSTVPMLAKPKTEKQRRNEQIASQEISLVIMKRPSNHIGIDEEQGLPSQEVAGDGCQDPDTRSEDGLGEDETYETPSENEEEDERDGNVSPESYLQSESEKLKEEGYGSTTEDNLNDPASDFRGPIGSEDDEQDSAQAPSGTQFQLCGTAMVQAHQREVDNLVAELKEQTKSEKARIREKIQAPISSQRARTEYPSKTQRREPRPTQQLPTLASIASEALKLELRSSQRSQHSTNVLNTSWRPRIPDTSGSDMQVDEEIVDSPTPPRERERATASCRQSLRRQPSIRSQSLQVVDQLPDSASFEIPPPITHDSQGGSIILGDTQNFRRSYPADIPETQVPDDEERETQVVMVSNGSYFSQASQQLSQPLRASNANRTISTPGRTRSRVHFDLHQRDDGNGLMASGISMSAAFQHTVSPVKSPPNRQPSQLQTPSQPRTLKELTRSASQGLGTLHGSARKRTVSLPFKPPFKQPSQASQA